MTTDQWQWLALLVLAGCGVVVWTVVVRTFEACQSAVRALRIRGLVCLQCDQPVLFNKDERFCSDACAEERGRTRKRLYPQRPTTPKPRPKR